MPNPVSSVFSALKDWPPLAGLTHVAAAAPLEIREAIAAVEKAVIGKTDVILLLFTCIAARGHCLLEDVPGVGKTKLVKSIANISGCEFRRIQFTPDLLPSDVIGVSIFNPQSTAFEFRPGPLFGQIVLADEINRTAPRTQSALLEAMEEGTVTVDGVVHTLPTPFVVLATQNPLEFEATFPLPEAQLDRFLMRLSIGYPSLMDEIRLLDELFAFSSRGERILTPQQLTQWQNDAERIHVDAGLKQYIVRLIQATREHPSIRLGASPRAGIGLLAAAKAFALLQGRSFVIPDDVQAMLMPVLNHRLILSMQARLDGQRIGDVLSNILEQVTVPHRSNDGTPVP